MSEGDFIPLVDAPSGAADEFRLWHTPSARAAATPADEFERGLAEGQALAAAAFAGERRRMQALIAAAEALQPVEPESLRTLICTTVERLVDEIVGATPVNAERLRQQIEEAMDLSGSLADDAVLTLSPGDIALLDGAALPLRIAEDPLLEPGTLRLETGSGTIEHGRAVQLEALRMQLGIEEPGRCR